MLARRLFATPLIVVALACGDHPTAPSRMRGVDPAALGARAPSNPTSDWGFPLNDAGLSLRSDGQSGDGTYSWYRNGECSVSSTMFVDGSGDNTFTFSYPQVKRKGCSGRTWTVAYPDGYSETLAYGGGVQVLENSSFLIPIGETRLRHFRFGANQVSLNNPAAERCAQGLVFGPNGANPAIGSDSVMVTRVDARTWTVQSQPAPNDHAYCIDNGQLYEMQVSFVIKASQLLP